MTENEESPHALALRVAKLERTVAELERRLEAAAATGAAAPSHAGRGRGVPALDAAGSTAAKQPAPVAAAPSVSRGPWPPWPRDRATRPTISLVPADPGQWVNRLGIALLLLGAAFGFKYSIDHGWIGPALRVLFGLGLGVVLLAASASVRRTRPGLSRMLAGGGIASGYLSIYAAFQLYQLISYAAAFLAMSVVTTAAFLLSMRDDDARMATLATIGGMATPFLLYTGGRSLTGLVGYTCLVLVGAGAMFTRCGWRVVLWTATIGGWLVIASAAWQVRTDAAAGAAVVQAGVIVVALGTWWLAVIREMLCAEDPARWRPTTFGFGEPGVASQRAGRRDTQTHELALVTPILVLVLSAWLWKLEDTSNGWLSLSLAAGWIAAAWHLRRMPGETARRLAVTHVLGAAVMVAFAMSLLLGDEARRLGLAAEALALLVLSARAANPQPAMFGHVLFALLTLESVSGILDDFARESRQAIGAAEVSVLGVVAGLAAAAAVTRGPLRARYFGAAQAMLLLWLLRALDPLPNGAALATAAWFTNAVVLMIAGLRSDHAGLRTAGAAVMGLTMAKLFLFDMSTVDAGWRIVTFLAFGVALLGLGYAFPALWRRDPSHRPVE